MTSRSESGSLEGSVDNAFSSGAGFKVLRERVAYKRFLTFTERTVCFPNGKSVEWDVVGHQSTVRPTFVVVVPFDTATKSFHLIREYAQGPNRVMYTFVSGALDERKHSSAEDCVRAELSEEARLKGGRIISLFNFNSVGISELKWGTNTFIPYLVIDPVVDETPLERDAEEFIQTLQPLKSQDIFEIIEQGELMMPSVQSFIMAVRRLKKMGLLNDNDIQL